MTYAEHLKEFYRRKQSVPISGKAQLLYYTLCEKFNSADFPKCLQVSLSSLTSETGLTKNQIIKARKELIVKGYLQAIGSPYERRRTIFIVPLNTDRSEVGSVLLLPERCQVG